MPIIPAAIRTITETVVVTFKRGDFVLTSIILCIFKINLKLFLLYQKIVVLAMLLIKKERAAKSYLAPRWVNCRGRKSSLRHYHLLEFRNRPFGGFFQGADGIGVAAEAGVEFHLKGQAGIG